MNRLFVTVEDIEAVIAAGFTIIRVYTDTSETGDFTTLDGSVTLVAAQESYEYTDLDGITATWYKTAYFGATPGESDKSDARKGETSAAYGTVIELRGQIKKLGATDDVELALLLDGTTDLIDRFCNRPDGFFADINASARTYVGTGGTAQFIDECTVVTLVEVKDSPSDTTFVTWAAADWFEATGDERFPNLNRLPRTLIIVSAVGEFQNFTSGTYTGLRGFRRVPSARGVPTVRITANWGYSVAIPPVIKQACLAQSARWYTRGKSSWARSTGQPELGQLRFTGNIQSVLDEDIRGMLVASRMVVPAIGRRP